MSPRTRGMVVNGRHEPAKRVTARGVQERSTVSEYASRWSIPSRHSSHPSPTSWVHGIQTGLAPRVRGLTRGYTPPSPSRFSRRNPRRGCWSRATGESANPWDVVNGRHQPAKRVTASGVQERSTVSEYASRWSIPSRHSSHPSPTSWVHGIHTGLAPRVRGLTRGSFKTVNLFLRLRASHSFFHCRFNSRRQRNYRSPMERLLNAHSFEIRVSQLLYSSLRRSVARGAIFSLKVRFVKPTS